MTNELSPQKATRLLDLYFNGYTQGSIAMRLHINQSTVSIYVARFRELADTKGIVAAQEEFNMTDTVNALHFLSCEMKKINLTVEELQTALTVCHKLSGLGVPLEEYPSLVKAAKAASDEGWLQAAFVLAKEEEAIGLDHQALVASYQKAKGDLDRASKEVNQITDRMKKLKQQLADAESAYKKQMTGLTDSIERSRCY